MTKLLDGARQHDNPEHLFGLYIRGEEGVNDTNPTTHRGRCSLAIVVKVNPLAWLKKLVGLGRDDSHVEGVTLLVVVVD